MNSSTAESRKQRETQVRTLTQQKQRLEDKIDKMYMDKLDGEITSEDYTRLSNKLRSDLTDLKFIMEGLAGENRDCFDSGKRLLELHLGG